MSGSISTCEDKRSITDISSGRELARVCLMCKYIQRSDTEEAGQIYS